MKIPTNPKPPGYVVYKLSLWDRLLNWWWNWRYPLQGVDILKHTREDQAVLDVLYKAIVDKQMKTHFPPMVNKDEEVSK